MADTSESLRDWSSLPSDILSQVLTCLDDTEMDCLRLRGVCTSWRSSLSTRRPSLQFPLKLILPSPELLSGTLTFNTHDQYAFLRQSKFYLISPPKASSHASVWLTRVEELKRSARTPPNVWKLQNPMSNVLEFKPLPEIKAVVNSLECRLSEVARSYRFSDYHHVSGIRNVVMLQFPKFGDTAGDFCLLALGIDGCLLLFKSEKQKWFRIPERIDNYGNIISFEGRFYATDPSKGKLLVIDPVIVEVKEIINDPLEESIFYELYHYLVESCGRLYLVHKVVDAESFYYSDLEDYDVSFELGKPLELKVFALGCSISLDGEANYFWEQVMSLGNRVFFVSNYVTFSVSAHEFGWDQGNCIFFTQEGFEGYESYYYSYYESNPEYCGRISKFCGVYTLEDGNIITADNLPSKYTSIFWPVPDWIYSMITSWQKICSLCVPLFRAVLKKLEALI